MFAILVGCLISCTEDVQPQKFTGVKNVPCWTEELIDSEAICKLLSVPASYDNIEGEYRTISFAILPALKLNSSVPDTGGGKQQVQGYNIPVIFLIGGPGPSGSYASSEFSTGAKADFLRRDRELILIDYRGTGMFEPYTECQMQVELLSVIGCIKSVLFSDIEDHEFRSAVFAQDTERVIKALGYQRVVLYGASYGTRLALTMMRDTPDRISHVVLDGVFPIEVNGFSQGARAILAGLSRIDSNCKSQPDCNSKFGELKPKIEILAKRWSERDDLEDLLKALAQFGHFPAAPLLIHQLEMLDVETSAKLVRKLAHIDSGAQKTDQSPPEAQFPRAMSLTMALHVVCSEEAAFIDEQPLDEERHQFNPFLVNTVRGISVGAPISPNQASWICAALAIDAAPELETQPVKSAIPTLLLSGGMDLQTSFEWGAQVDNELSNSQHYILPYSDHVTLLDNDACGRNLAAQFIRAPERKLKLDCLRATDNTIVLDSHDLEKEFSKYQSF